MEFSVLTPPRQCLLTRGRAGKVYAAVVQLIYYSGRGVELDSLLQPPGRILDIFIGEAPLWAGQAVDGLAQSLQGGSQTREVAAAD